MVDGPVTPLRFRHRDTSVVRGRVPRRVTRILTLATTASPDQDPGPRTKSTPAEPPRPHANRGQLPNSPTLSRSSRKITDAPHARAGDRADHDDGAQVGQTAVGDTARETSGRGAPERVKIT